MFGLSGDIRGSVSMIFGISLMVLIMFSGFTVDIAMGLRSREKMQSALDSAVLAAVRDAKSEDEAIRIAKSYYESNRGKGTISQVKYTNVAGAITVSASANYASPNYFAGIIGKSETQVSLESAARIVPNLTELTIKPVSASGAWSKTITLHMIDEAGVDKTLGYVDYNFPMKSGVPSTITTDIVGSVTLTNARAAYFQMDLDPTRSWYVRYMKTLTMRTNDPLTAHHIFVDGVQLPKGTAVNLTEIVKCGKKVRIAWEDGGGWDGQDFFFDVTGQCIVSGHPEPTLVR